MFFSPNCFAEVSSFEKQPVIAFKQSKEAKQKFKENFGFEMLPLKNDNVFVENFSQKKTWSFSKLHSLNGFNRKNVLHWPTDFLYE